MVFQYNFISVTPIIWIHALGVDELPRGDETPGVATEGEGMTGKDRQGGREDGTPPTTQATEESGAGGGNEVMTSGLRTAPPLRPQRGTTADEDSMGPQPRKSDGADSARTENGTHLRRKYGLLAPEVPEGGTDNAGLQVRGDSHGATRGTADEGQMETEMGDETG